MKKIMILGASYSVVPLIQAAKRLGLYTIAASIPGEYPGFDEADEACFVDITDPEAVLEQAKGLAIDAVATCCMDVGLRAQGAVCSALGLPGPGRETVERCTNKYRMKEAFLAGGVNTARFVRIGCEADLEPAMEQLRFPLIIKAVDQMGSRGIFRCDTPEQVRENYPKSMAASRQSYCVLEEFLVGEMFGMEAMFQHGELVYLLPMNNDLRNGNPPFPIGHSVPWSHQEQLYAKAEEQVIRAAKALGCTDCPMDFDAMLVGDEVYLIEATARAGATGIADMVSIYYGVNYFEVIAALAMGQPVGGYFAGKALTPCMTHLFSSAGTGRLAGIENHAPLSEQIVELAFNVSPGDEVRRMTNGRDRIGQAIVKGASVEACRACLSDAMGKIILEIEEEEHAGIHRYPVL